MSNADLPSPASILIADDDADVLKALRLLLKSEGYRITTASSPSGIREILRDQDFDVLLLDMNYLRGTTSGQEGLDLLSDIQALDSALPIVVMTAWASIELAVEAMRRGARDFVAKPWKNERLLATLRTQIEMGRVVRRSRRLEAENQLLRGERELRLIAESRAMRPVLEMIARAGSSEANVLITGENGTGKSVVARALHGASPRASKSLITVNVGSLPETIFESEFFGHVKGAFTDAKTDRLGRFELAEGGTLFLDEIANIPLSLQARFLRVLETGEYERIGSSKTLRADVRILSATNADLAREVAAGRFRQDLLYRLNTVEIRIPPLRDRPEDLPLLAEHFRERHAGRYRKRVTGFATAAMQELLRNSWPGNVRELDHAVERAVLMARTDRIQVDDLGLRSGGQHESRSFDEMSLEDVERLLIQKAIARSQGNMVQAAKTLGLSRSALYRRLEKYGL